MGNLPVCDLALTLSTTTSFYSLSLDGATGACTLGTCTSLKVRFKSLPVTLTSCVEMSP